MTNKDIARKLVAEWDHDDGLRAKLRELIGKALAERVEECAKICEGEVIFNPPEDHPVNLIAERCAMFIRQLNQGK